MSRPCPHRLPPAPAHSSIPIQEYFMAALTGSERGLPVGSFLNDTIEAGSDVAEVAMVWQPYDDKARRLCRSKYVHEKHVFSCLVSCNRCACSDPQSQISGRTCDMFSGCVSFAYVGNATCFAGLAAGAVVGAYVNYKFEIPFHSYRG